MGHIKVAPIMDRKLSSLGEKCLPKDTCIWVVESSGVHNGHTRKGLGKQLYLKAAKYVSGYNAILSAHENLAGGTTTFSAKRLWKSLKKWNHPNLEVGSYWIRYFELGMDFARENKELQLVA